MFHKFHRQLMHSSLVKMLESLKLGMTTPEVVCCADDHFRQAIYSLGPYIGDYPEQTALVCVVQNWCPKSVINQFRYLCLCLRSLSRCTAPADNLDSERYPPHSKEHTELISAEFELGQLWDEYGDESTHQILPYGLLFSSFYRFPYTAGPLTSTAPT